VTFLTTRQLEPCSSTSIGPPVGRLVQQLELEPLPSSDQGSGTCCSGQGYPSLHLVSAVTEPAYRAASGLSFTAMGQETFSLPFLGFCLSIMSVLWRSRTSVPQEPSHLPTRTMYSQFTNSISRSGETLPPMNSNQALYKEVAPLLLSGLVPPIQ
jgi:hypothetical protein